MRQEIEGSAYGGTTMLNVGHYENNKDNIKGGGGYTPLLFYLLIVDKLSKSIVDVDLKSKIPVDLLTKFLTL